VDRNLERIALARGRIAEYRDTVTCRTTFAIELADVRQFIQNAPGNHFALVYDDWSQALKALGQALGIEVTLV
jgi:L-fucose isomerase-like protein